jgi:hypothetical protein
LRTTVIGAGSGNGLITRNRRPSADAT